jgi:hypothetical protein
VILKGNCLDTLKTLPDCSIDSIVTDPPYELGFMGKSWDASGIAYNVEMWRECLRVLKPGGHLLAFSGSRTYHRMTVAIEDAGFEIRDQIMYLYGSGFPKSLDVSKAIDKVNGEPDRLLKFVKWMKTTGLKAAQINQAIEKSDVGSHNLRSDQPAIPTAELWKKLRPLIADVPDWVDELVARIEAEREVVGVQPNAMSGWNMDGTTKFADRDITAPATPEAQRWQGWGTALKPAHEPICVARKPLTGTVASNVLEWGTGALNIDGSRVAHTGDGIWGLTQNNDIGYGGGTAGSGYQTQKHPEGRWPANVIHDGSDEVLAGFPTTGPSKAGGMGGQKPGEQIYELGLKKQPRGGYDDLGGSAARFFSASFLTLTLSTISAYIFSMACATTAPLMISRKGSSRPKDSGESTLQHSTTHSTKAGLRILGPAACRFAVRPSTRAQRWKSVQLW